ncbi:aspartyl-phosphate phosphatase Spo0E family protein [Anoxybacillus rupiensis]|uniref:Aspartyl-phosphate phosphatase Spo0E family protein n=2 Tax=Bacillales TaxID=1385 RepID=A0ABD5IVK4_9BACL|nr:MULTISPECIES: aspartyl-phosphate phosphatase Spo0E family protein [Anoxybacillus]MED5051820.1 aspartyl-phosphate phosphatase Spo0E family protein [Anoxybacillus rupiensis]
MLIEEKRQQMIELALTYGLTAKETIQCSQELDELLNIQLREALASKQHHYSLSKSAYLRIE